MGAAMSKKYTPVTIRNRVLHLPHWDYRELRKMVWNQLTRTVHPFTVNTPLDDALARFFSKYEDA